jgi:hypothetical protein
MRDDELRRAYAALMARAPSEDRPAVPLERLLAAVEGRGSEADRIAAIDAAMADGRTASELELLRAVASNRRPAARTVPWRYAPIALAAAALALVAVPATRAVLRDPAPDAVRSATADAILLSPPEVAEGADGRRFAWRPVPGARAYALEILTASGTLVFTTRTADTTVVLPDDVPLEPSVEHRWWVAAELPDGSQRASNFRRLVVRRP